MSHRLFKMVFEVGGDPIVVEQGVIDVEEKHHLWHGHVSLHAGPLSSSGAVPIRCAVIEIPISNPESPADRPRTELWTTCALLVCPASLVEHGRQIAPASG